MNNPSPSPTLTGQIADLRRLYMHLIAAGEWSHPQDTALLSRTVRTLEELSEGGCRQLCQTRKETWREGYQVALMDRDDRPIATGTLEERSLQAWRKYK